MTKKMTKKYYCLYDVERDKIMQCVPNLEKIEKYIVSKNKQIGKDKSEDSVDEIMVNNNWDILISDKLLDESNYKPYLHKNKKPSKRMGSKKKTTSKKGNGNADWQKEAKSLGINFCCRKKEDVLKDIENAKGSKGTDTKKEKNKKRAELNREERIKKYLAHLKKEHKYSGLEEKLKGMPIKAKDIFLHKLYINSKRYEGLTTSQREKNIERDKSRKAKNYGWRFSNHRYGTTSKTNIGEKLPDEVIKKYGNKVPTLRQIAAFKAATEKERAKMFDGSFPYYKADIRSGDIYMATRHKHLKYEGGGIILSKYLSYDELKDFLGIDKITSSSYEISDDYVAKKVPIYPLFKIVKK